MPILSTVGGTLGYGRHTEGTTIFNYPNFSSTTGLSLISTAAVISNLLYLTQTSTADVGNVYRSTAIPFNRNFTFQWNFECSGGTTPPADGFCLQWTPTNNTNGGGGGSVGYVTTAVQAFQFKTYTNNSITWLANNVSQQTSTGQNFYRNLYYWADYNHGQSTMKLYWSTTSTKPTTANFTCSGFTFNATSYYIGFGAATGGATANHILRSMKLIFL